MKDVTVWVQRFPDRKYLVLQWHDPETGRRKSKSAQTTDAGEAEQKAKDLAYELRHGKYSDPCRMTWEEFCDLYADEKLGGNRLATQKKAGYVFESFETIARPKNLGAVNERMISRYATQLRSDGKRPATIQGHLAYLKAALRWAVDQKFLRELPKVVMPKVSKKGIIRTITAEEFERLLAVAPDKAWEAFLCTAWYAGMRRNEMLDLEWNGDAGKPCVDFGRKRIWIPAAYNKADADQWLPLHPDLAETLLPLRKPSGRLFALSHSPREVSRKFTALAKRAGLRVTLHDIRRSFGSRYAPHVAAPVLQRLMRHADIKTTLAFYTNVDGALDDAILKA